MATLRVYHVEVTLPAEVDEDATWRAIGTALADEGFNDVLYGGSEEIEEDD